MSFMISSSVNRFVVGGQRVQRRVGVVLLADPGEQLEARCRRTCGRTPCRSGRTRRAWCRCRCARRSGRRRRSGPSAPTSSPSRLGLPAAAEQAGAGQLLDADGEAHVALAGLDGHDRRAQRGGAGGAGVGHVVDGDAGLADLLLQLLADAGAGAHQVAGGEHADVASSSRRRRRGRPCAASAARSTVSLSGCLPNFVMWIPRIQMSSLRHGRSPSVSAGLEAEADGLGAVVVGADRVRWPAAPSCRA